MQKLFKTALLASALTLTAASTLAAERVSENRAVDGRVTKIQLDGVVSLNVKQGATASLVVYADKDQLNRVTTTVSGDTLRINTESRGHWFSRENSEVRAELTLPGLAEVVSSGVGTTDVRGFNGDALQLVVSGAGGMNVASKYRKLNARLSGVGYMNIENADCENMELSLPGAGNVKASGSVKALKAVVSGVGSLNAKELTSAKTHLILSGLGSATVTAKEEANVILSGLGSATVYGNPAQRMGNSSGMGSISWKQ